MQRILLIALGMTILLVSCSSGTNGSGPRSSAAPRPTSGAAEGMEVPLADAYTPLVASVLGPATTFPFRGTDGKYHVVYDLEFRNASRVPATLQRIEVVDAAQSSRVIVSYEGRALTDRLRTLVGETGTVQDSTIEPSGGRIVYVELVFESLAQAPRAVRHRVSALGAANPGAREATPLAYVITLTRSRAARRWFWVPR